MTTEKHFQQKLQQTCKLLSGSLDDLHKTSDDLAQVQQSLAQCSVNDTSSKGSGKDSANDAFDSPGLQEKMKNLCLVLSHDATKFTLACKPPRKPQDATKMLEDINNTLLRTIGFFYDIPASAATGLKTYRKAYRMFVDSVLRSSISLLASFLDNEHQLDASSSNSFMMSTAALWEVCKMAPAQLPRDNAQAVALEWKQLLETLADAKNEADEMSETTDRDSGVISDGDEDSDFDIEVDPVIAKRCALLVALTRLLFQKIQKRCTMTDELLAHGKHIVEETDVLVSRAYDLEVDEMTAAMNEYIDTVRPLVNVAQQDADKENQAWFTMCLTKYEEIPTKTFDT
ncbi:hypothetical protein BC940DRAFT_252313 [Gongronella butleri]|nr:hypothetical protein BC940DRAFT_252313 [Gongronella butleri]